MMQVEAFLGCFRPLLWDNLFKKIIFLICYVRTMHILYRKYANLFCTICGSFICWNISVYNGTLHLQQILSVNTVWYWCVKVRTSVWNVWGWNTDRNRIQYSTGDKVAKTGQNPRHLHHFFSEEGRRAIPADRSSRC